MKEKISIITALFLTVFIGYILYAMHQRNLDLLRQLETRDQVIEKRLDNDTSYVGTGSDASEVLQHYSPGRDLMVEEGEVSTPALIKILKDLYDENDSLRSHLHQVTAREQKADSITSGTVAGYLRLVHAYQDSTALFKHIVRRSREEYGISYRFNLTRDGRFTTSKAITRADSALKVYPYIKQLLKLDSANDRIPFYFDEQKEVQQGQAVRVKSARPRHSTARRKTP